MNPEVAAWALMGIGELRALGVMGRNRGLFGGTAPRCPEEVFEEMMNFIDRALAPTGAQPTVEG